MAAVFPNQEWLEGLKDYLNTNEKYARIARKWEGDLMFDIKADGALEADLIVYLDLWHGECREALKISNPSEKSPSFEVRAPVDTWKKVVNKELNPIKGIMTRQLVLKGNMLKILKAPKSAIELVECAIRIDTEWP